MKKVLLKTYVAFYSCSFKRKYTMQDRESVLQKKATRIQEELKRWAKAQHLLQVGEQIEFVMSIKDIPIVVPKIVQGILGISIPKFLTIERCQALGISSRTRNILVGRIYGTVYLGNWREEPIYHEIITVGDLIKLSKKQIMSIRNLGVLSFSALETVLRSVGIELPEFPE